MNKKIVAREWLYFIACLLLGIFLFLLSAKNLGHDRPIESLLGLESLPDFYGAWLLSLSPYIIVQTVRFTAWAVKTLKQG